MQCCDRFKERLLISRIPVAGNVLGQILYAAPAVPVVVGTGNGVMSAITLGSKVKIGTYTVKATGATAFTITDPNGVSTATERERRVGGVDVTLNYQPLQNNQFAGFTWRTEVLNSSSRFRFDPDGVPSSGDESTRFENSLGLYSLVTAKLSRAWNVNVF